MNFYKHHLGDYDGATAHLSWDEDMAYTRLMRVYYRLEKPLPADPAALNRLVRAHSKTHRQAVDRVLSEFFRLEADGWHNKRCDEEIASYQAQSATNKRIAHERTVQRIVQRTVDDSSTKGPPNHKPEPEANNQKDKSDVGLAPDDARQRVNFQLRKQAAEVISFLNAKTGRNFDCNGANADHVVARLKTGETVDDCRAVIALKCRQWNGDAEMAKYLRPETLFNRTKFASYKGELGAPDNTSPKVDL